MMQVSDLQSENIITIKSLYKYNTNSNCFNICKLF